MMSCICTQYNTDNLCVRCGREFFSIMDEDPSTKKMCCREMTSAVYNDMVDVLDVAALTIGGKIVPINMCPWCGKALFPYLEFSDGEGV